MASSAQFPDEQNDDGNFDRQGDAFRDWVRADGSSDYPAESDRYHLYVCYACPWAHRIIIARELKGLQHVIGLTAVDPWRDDHGWAFREGDGFSADPINGFAYLKEAYLATDPDYRGRHTVPVLWDKHTQRIVSNSDDDLLRMLNAEFNAFAARAVVDLFPADHRDEIDRINAIIYEKVNNGVYRAGFATTQDAYEDAVAPLFATLDALDDRLSRRRYLVGPRLTEADIRLFVTLVRFDAVYHGHFKCNVQQIADYPNLGPYLRDIYQHPGVADTVRIDHIKTHYYGTHLEINPTGIIPVGPELDFDTPTPRDRLD
ncbi:glutathione S-transferase family protein [Synoicihabitans lomoniglobus]|uniref:Glutathione S-transferase family protein n=1 Tax=Synoicihabitans lomoniglobus TaxID=2909285 RepID=A0AAE9ZV57_9BACT|nr:glutathione S-transferase family protein [Opitutaceae bacterium LMO-M01]WED63956.1 glutathione S-transferase family protein [Opitutaceae bacterium LMO-M01]